MPSIFEYITLLKQNDTSNRTIGYIYNKCLRIAITTVAKKYPDTCRKLYNIDSTFEGIASDAIIPLFTSNNPGEPIGLLKSLQLWEKPIEKDEDADFFIHKVVWNRVAQHITRMLKESDPFFKKIHSSLKHYIDKNNYNKLSYFGIVFITETHNKAIVGQVISNEETENLPDTLFYCKYDKILENVFMFIEKETDYFSAIPLNALIRRLKSIKWNEHMDLNGVTAQPHFEDKMDINSIVASSLKHIYKNLDQSYSKGLRIDEKLLNAYKSTLKDIAEDLKNGGISRGLYEYLNFYMNDLSKDEFYKGYHSQLNYLIMQLKKTIAERIKI